MLKHTIQILSEYDLNSIYINISNKNINGLLDVGNYQKLVKLDCSNNRITQIMNLPDSLKYFICENNLIQLMDNLPPNLIEINWKIKSYKNIIL